jgi:MYXO-CTERM domain-containing protein
MNKKFISGLFVVASALTGALANAGSASAFTWNNTWSQPQIFGKAAVGFNDQPFQQFVNKEGLAVPNSGQNKVNPNNLFLKYNYDVKVSFINEGAGYRNQLAYTATGGSNKSGLLFNDISCAGVGCVSPGAATLKLGDTVKLGMINGETQLDFGLRANGFNRGSNSYVFGTPDTGNPDGLQHVVAYTYGKKYLVLGFEDLYGTGKTAQGNFNEISDRDFNDSVFVVDIGEDNVNYLNNPKKAPEPVGAVALIGMGVAAAVRRRKAS